MGSHWHTPLFTSFTPQDNGCIFVIDIVNINGNSLADARTRGVKELHQSAVAQIDTLVTPPTCGLK
jgi:hypothetical protein